MNALYNTSLRLTTSLRRDLDTLSSHVSQSPSQPLPASLCGQITTSLSSLTRTLSDYESLQRNELNDEKRIKAADRLKNFKQELAGFRERYEETKREREIAVQIDSRSELLGRRGYSTASPRLNGIEGSSTPENPYAQPHSSNATALFGDRSQRNNNGDAQGIGFGGSGATYSREDHALREQSFFAQTNSQLDQYLDRGRAVLNDLGQQRDILKKTQKRLYDVGNTLGVSTDTIKRVERRVKGDKFIFWGGCIVFFSFVVLVIYFLK